MSPYAADEIGLALRLTPGTAAIRLAQAQRLDAEMVATRQAWLDGRLDSTKVRAILDGTDHLTPDTLPRCRTGSCPVSTSGPRGSCGPRRPTR